MARLPQGVTKRKDGTFQKRFTIDGNRYSVYGHSTKELQEKELAKRKEIEQGLTSKSAISLNTYFEKYFIPQKSDYTKQATLYRYINAFKCVDGKLKSKRMKSIDKETLLKHRETMVKYGYSVYSINHTYKVLHNIFNSAVVDEIIIKNPMTGIKKLKDEKPQAIENIHRALTEEEQKLFMEYAKSSDNWFYELFALMISTGIRQGEALALEWSDIDYKNNVIHINKTKTTNLKGQVITGTPKTEKSKRDIPLTEDIKRILKAQRKKCNLLAETGDLKIHNVFISVRGGVIATPTTYKHIKTIVEALNKQGYEFEVFTPHAFRDTFATRFIEQGGSPQTLKTILGHSSLSMTMDLYAHVLPNTKAEEMNRIIIAI